MKKRMQVQLLVLLLFLGGNGFAQSPQGYKWWNPFDSVSHVLAAMEAGYLTFNTNASDIVIRYSLAKGNPFSPPRIPTKGNAGIDLYAIDHNGQWKWVPGTPVLGDTIEYRFERLAIDPAYRGRTVECRLFLPMLSDPRWMQVGVPADGVLMPVPLQREKPIVVYSPRRMANSGIAGPGMRWTAILARKLDRPVVESGALIPVNNFPGSEFKLPLPHRHAAIYILDGSGFTGGGPVDSISIRNAMIEVMQKMQSDHPGVPVLLLQKSTANMIDTVQRQQAQKLNRVVHQVFGEQVATGSKTIFQLSDADIHLGIHATVDGSELNDIGMQQLADACEDKVRSILHESVGLLSVTIPVVQSRDGWYNWRQRHAEILALNKSKPPANIIFANSIVHFWGGQPNNPNSRGEDSWNQWLEPLGLRNMGFGWDRIENVLWRIHHDELDGFAARNVVLMIGTNNLGSDNDSTIVAGLANLVAAVKLRQPAARILLSGIFPRRNMEGRITELNLQIKQLASQTGATFINIGPLLLDKQGKTDESLFTDGLHPNAAGYQKIAPALAALLKN